MRTVQLDKNAGSNKLKDQCNAEGLLECFLLPRRPVNLRDEGTDREVAEFAILKNNLTLTFDRTFALESAVALAQANPGVLVVHFDDDDSRVRRMTRKDGMRILENFKKAMPNWHQVPWQNSIIELSPQTVVVYCSTTIPAKEIARLTLTNANFVTQLTTALEQNSNRRAIKDHNTFGDQTTTTDGQT